MQTTCSAWLKNKAGFKAQSWPGNYAGGMMRPQISQIHADSFHPFDFAPAAAGRRGQAQEAFGDRARTPISQGKERIRDQRR
jgi:hypothetical protein